MTDRSDHHGSSFAVNRSRDQLVKDRTGKHFDFNLGPESAQPRRGLFELASLLRERFFEESRINFHHPGIFLHMQQDQLRLEPPCHCRRDIHRLHRHLGGIGAANQGSPPTLLLHAVSSPLNSVA